MVDTSVQTPPRVLSPDALRSSVGAIAIALPFVLALGKIALNGDGLLDSISDYYYSAMRNVFVGSLTAFAVFLASYRGYARIDNRLTNLGAVLVIGVAFFPTSPGPDATAQQRWVGVVHYLLASGFFITIALISLLLFTRSDGTLPTPRKLLRNKVYRVCGVIILACVAIVLLLHVVDESRALAGLHPVFWVETIAVVAFGASWLVKSEVILGDQ
jgi:hypothetical protein